jgi:hypothetical protein
MVLVPVLSTDATGIGKKSDIGIATKYHVLGISTITTTLSMR